MGPAAIMIGRSVFVCFVLVNLSLYGCDAVSAAIMVGRSVFVFLPSSICRLLDWMPCQQ